MKGLQIEYTFTFVRGGISAEKKVPYLLLSNGRKELYVNFPKNVRKEIDDDTFASYSENDEITLVVNILPGSDTVTFVRVLEG